MKKRKLLYRLVSSYAMIVSIIFCCIFAFAFYNYTNIIFKEKNNVLEKKADIVSEQLNAVILKIYNIHSQMNQSVSLQNLVDGTQKEPEKSYQAMSEFRKMYTAIKGIYLSDAQGGLLAYASDSLSGIPDFHELEAFIESKAYRAFFRQDDSLIYYGSFYRSDTNGFKYKAYITIVLDPQRIVYNMNYHSQGTFQALYLIDSGRQELISSFGDLISEPDQLFHTEHTGRIQSQNHSYSVFRLHITEYPQWELAALVNYSFYSKEVRYLTLLIGCLAILALLLTIVVSYFTSKRITQPISLVQQAMTAVEKGEFPAPLAAASNDETSDLVHGFNHMVKSLKELNEDITREQEEKRKYEVERIKTQMDLLQSQVNPHFIHNTLNGLKFMALSSGNQEIAATINSFNTLLRASISTDTEFTTVEEECHYVMEYMNIQKMRYASRTITCTAHIDQAAAQGLLPRLILQPLVENSLFHGILPREDQEGMIKIVALVEREMLHIYITDNGLGMPEEKIKRINSGELRITNGYNHIGLHNVKERLNLLYQTNCRFLISSELNSGTTIYFCVPYKEDSECIQQ